MENHSVIKQIAVLIRPTPLNKCPVFASIVERTGQVGVISSLGRSERRLCLSMGLAVATSLSSLHFLCIHLAGQDCMSLKREKKCFV